MSRFVLIVSILSAMACKADDTKGDDTAGDTNTDTLVGTWVSTGADLAPLFVDYTDYVAIYATFNDDGTYAVEGAYEASASDTFSGTYVVDLGTDPHGITLSQASPSTVTSQGIWAVDGDTLTYEVLQTQPDTTGCTPPTAAGGFGSTDCSYLDPGDNTQIYRRQ